MAKKKKQDQSKPTAIKNPERFRPDPEDDVYVINGYDARKKGPFVPEIYKVKRKQLDELRRRGWKYLPDFHREKYAEQQKVLKAYQEMFAYMSNLNA